MERIRFGRFPLLIEGIHKSIGKMKLDTVSDLGIKGVHVFWLCTLLEHPGGLTAAELASESMIDRSLVSRELAALRKNGFVEQVGNGHGRTRLCLTDSGRELAARIADRAIFVQSEVGAGLSEAELRAFYETLEKLHGNLQRLAAQGTKESD